MADEEKIIEVSDLVKYYGKFKAVDHAIVNDQEFVANASQQMTIVRNDN